MPVPVSSTVTRTTGSPGRISPSPGAAAFADGEASAVRHGVARIGREVQQRALEQRAVGEARRGAGGLPGEGDVAAERPVQQRYHPDGHHDEDAKLVAEAEEEVGKG
jgi:hypothetical protein